MLFVFGMARLVLTQQNVEKRSPSQYFRSLAMQAKADGKSKLKLPGPQITGISAENLQQAIEDSRLITLRPTAIQTVSDASDLYTWYKCKTLSVLWTPVRPKGRAHSLDQIPPELQPSSLLPLAQNEVLLIRRGGIITVEGVILEISNGAEMSLDKEYLLFAALASDGKVVAVPLGRAGIFSLSKDGLLMPSVPEEEEDTLVREVKEQGSLNALRSRAINRQ